MVRPYLARRLYSAESVNLGPAWSVHPIDSAMLTELHLVRHAGTERRTPCHVSQVVRFIVAAADPDCRVCITAIWPSFQNVPNTLAANVPATTQQMVGFIVFWVLSFPFLFIRPERFKKPFFFSSLGCGLAMVPMMIWSLSVARGVGPVFYKSQNVLKTSRWSISWLMMAGLN